MSARTPHPAFDAAGAHKPEPDPPQGVAAVSFLVDAESHSAYRHGVHHYECDRCHRPIGKTGRVRRSRIDGLVLTAVCAECLEAGVGLRLADKVDGR